MKKDITISPFLHFEICEYRNVPNRITALYNETKTVFCCSCKKEYKLAVTFCKGCKQYKIAQNDISNGSECCNAELLI